MQALQNGVEDSGKNPFVVACVQMQPHVGEKSRNLAHSIRQIEAAANNGAALVVLPELTSSGYVFANEDEAFALSEQIPSGEVIQAWLETARRLGIYVVSGFLERDGVRLYNSAILAGPSGYIGSYRKLHLWDSEKIYFTPGDKPIPVFETALGRIAIAICYDGWFPEVYRLAIAQGAEIVCMPTNWVPMPGQRPDWPSMATTLAMAAAHSNGIVIACADRIGEERGQPFIGRSLIVGPDGWPIAGPASQDREEILYAVIDPMQIRLKRSISTRNHILCDRRTDMYGPLLQGDHLKAAVDF